MHIVDLDGAKQGSIAQIELIMRLIGATGLKVQVGGGVRSTEDVKRLLDAGAQRVVIGTKALEDWGWFDGLARGEKLAEKLVLAVDAKQGMIATRAWTETTSRSAAEVAGQVRGWGLGGILYTDVARDGMLQGPNLEHTRLLTQSTDVPIIASGGVGNLDHIKALLQLPIWGVIVGRSLHDGSLDLAEAIRLAGAKTGGKTG
jgi:phosphoribosylformimino-5-aminoimidazole carboxamide ribotide isomerase